MEEALGWVIPVEDHEVMLSGADGPVGLLGCRSRGVMCLELSTFMVLHMEGRKSWRGADVDREMPNLPM